MSSRAHPHSRGENVGSRPPVGSRSGSSPLTRGKRREQAPGREQVGLIPAHAGKTWVCDCHCGCSRLIPAHAGKTGRSGHTGSSRLAHPRSRGENSSASSTNTLAAGSSPLTRGKPYCLLLVRVRVGLIPAHAGKTRVMVAWSVMRAAHPRSRGENDEKWAASDAMQGSSPLTRGKRARANLNSSQRGLIPAHAGKTTNPSPFAIWV